MRQSVKLTGGFLITVIYVLSYHLLAQEPPSTKPSEEKIYQLIPSLKEGGKFEVGQSQKWDGKLSIKSEGISTYRFSKFIQNKYTEEIISVDGATVKSERTYLVSRIKTNIPTSKPEEGIKDEATSLQGKKIALEVKNNQIIATKVLSKEKNVILKDDLPYITPFTEYNELIPHTSIKIGDTWQIRTAEFGKVIFKQDYEADLCEVTGKAKLEEITNYQGFNSAKISISLKATRKQSETTPNLTVELTGTCYYALDKNVLTSVDLKGPFTLDKEIKLADKSLVTINATGEIIISSQVTPMEK